MSASGVRFELNFKPYFVDNMCLIRAAQLRRKEPYNALMHGFGMSGLVVFKSNLQVSNLCAITSCV